MSVWQRQSEGVTCHCCHYVNYKVWKKANIGGCMEQITQVIHSCK